MKMTHSRIVRKAPYDLSRGYDIYTEKVVNAIRKKIKNEDDDYLVLLVGDTGSGKSTLMLHMYETYDPEGCDVEFIGLDYLTHAQALQKAKGKPLPRFVADDEANVNRRGAMSKKNRDKLDLYMAIRGLNIFHVWCNPSLDIIDKPFVEERIKAVCYVIKDNGRKRTDARVFYWFKRNDVIKMFKEAGNLKLHTINEYKKEYATYKGWFRKYEGKLLEPYLKRKKKRMQTKVEEYFQNYGQELLCKTDLSKQLLISRSTISSRAEELRERGELIKEEDYTITSANRWLFTPKGAEKIKNYSKI